PWFGTAIAAGTVVAAVLLLPGALAIPVLAVIFASAAFLGASTWLEEHRSWRSFESMINGIFYPNGAPVIFMALGNGVGLNLRSGERFSMGDLQPGMAALVPPDMLTILEEDIDAAIAEYRRATNDGARFVASQRL